MREQGSGTDTPGSLDENHPAGDGSECLPGSDRPTPSLGPVSLPSSSVDGATIPKSVEVAGSIGVKLGILSVGLAIVGILSSWLHVQPLGNVAIFLSLVLIVIAMFLGMIFQIYAYDWSTVRN